MWTEPDVVRVPVEGGELTVGRWGDGAEPVLASHGITANHRSFGELAWQLAKRNADVTLYAVDHRGRGGSAEVPGPFGMSAHARDLVSVLDHFELEVATVVGHSMGTYVAVVGAEQYPQRFTRLLLVDGGWIGPVDVPPDADVEQLVRSVIGPALDRLDRTFASPEAYLDHWRAHPAFQGEDFTDVVEAYFAYDVVPDGGVWRSPVKKDAVLFDGGEVRTDTHVRTALERVSQPAVVMWAPLGLLNQPPPYIPKALVDDVIPKLDNVTAVAVDGVNHYTLLTSPRGARQVADQLLRLL